MTYPGDSNKPMHRASAREESSSCRLAGMPEYASGSALRQNLAGFVHSSDPFVIDGYMHSTSRSVVGQARGSAMCEPARQEPRSHGKL